MNNRGLCPVQIRPAEDAQDELGEGLDAVSDDLEDVEELLFGDKDEGGEE